MGYREKVRDMGGSDIMIYQNMIFSEFNQFLETEILTNNHKITSHILK